MLLRELNQAASHNTYHDASTLVFKQLVLRDLDAFLSRGATVALQDYTALALSDGEVQIVTKQAPTVGKVFIILVCGNARSPPLALCSAEPVRIKSSVGLLQSGLEYTWFRDTNNRAELIMTAPLTMAEIFVFHDDGGERVEDESNKKNLFWDVPPKISKDRIELYVSKKAEGVCKRRFIVAINPPTCEPILLHVHIKSKVPKTSASKPPQAQPTPPLAPLSSAPMSSTLSSSQQQPPPPPPPPPLPPSQQQHARGDANSLKRAAALGDDGRAAKQTRGASSPQPTAALMPPPPVALSAEVARQHVLSELAGIRAALGGLLTRVNTLYAVVEAPAPLSNGSSATAMAAAMAAAPSAAKPRPAAPSTTATTALLPQLSFPPSSYSDLPFSLPPASGDMLNFLSEISSSALLSSVPPPSGASTSSSSVTSTAYPSSTKRVKERGPSLFDNASAHVDVVVLEKQ